jgi:hypothetical protein
MQRKCVCCMLSLVSALGVEISECSGRGGGMQRQRACCIATSRLVTSRYVPAACRCTQ